MKPIPTGFTKSGRPLTGIQCVLFDIYGTLLISASGDINLVQKNKQLNEKIENLIDRYEIASTPQALTAALTQAIAATHQTQREKGILYPEVEIDRIWKQILNKPSDEHARTFALEFELAVNPVYPMPHLQEVLRTCRRRQIRMGLISNAQFYTVCMFKWLLNASPEDLGFHPGLIFLSYRMGCAKPSEEIFKKAASALKKMHIPPQAVLFMGNDMLNDIWPAGRIGFKTALFAGDKRSLRMREDDPRCRNLAADLVLTDLKQLFDFII